MQETSEAKSVMDADEIVPLTCSAVRELLRSRQDGGDDEDLGRRQGQRWPFPGAVEIWLPVAENREEHQLATLHDLGESGMGVRADIALEPGQVFSVAVHQPEVTFHGRAMVRHCTPRRSGYHIGMEFLFPDGPA